MSNNININTLNPINHLNNKNNNIINDNDEINNNNKNLSKSINFALPNINNINNNNVNPYPSKEKSKLSYSTNFDGGDKYLKTFNNTNNMNNTNNPLNLKSQFNKTTFRQRERLDKEKCNPIKSNKSNKSNNKINNTTSTTSAKYSVKQNSNNFINKLSTDFNTDDLDLNLHLNKNSIFTHPNNNTSMFNGSTITCSDVNRNYSNMKSTITNKSSVINRTKKSFNITKNKESEFLHIVEYKKIELKNDQVKALYKEVHRQGPNYQYCERCNYKNLEYFKE